MSYDAITPIAARRIFEAVYWRREIRWQIDAIHVLAPIRFGCATLDGVRPLESTDSLPFRPVDEVARRIVLLEPAYIIDAHFELATETANPAQHTKMFTRALRLGRYFRRPYLGLPDYPADLAIIEGDSPSGSILRPHSAEDRDLGWMAHDLAPTDNQLRFFRAHMVRGAIRVPAPGSPNLLR